MAARLKIRPHSNGNIWSDLRSYSFPTPIHLFHQFLMVIGAPAGIRTPNLLIRSQMLCTFSYGRKVGRPYLEKHKSKRMMKMLERSERFYERYGWWSVVIARYIPWVRTFVPPIAGAVKMNYYKFLSANALGALLWGAGITLAGFYSGSIPWVKDISYALAVFFITASLLSALINYLREKRD